MDECESEAWCPAAGQQWFPAGLSVGCVLPCEREAVLLMVPSVVSASVLSSASVQLSFQAGTGLGIRVVPPLPSSPGPRPISSPPQLELVLLPSPSRYLIAEEQSWPLPGFGSCTGKISVASLAQQRNWYPLSLQEGSQWGDQEG